MKKKYVIGGPVSRSQRSGLHFPVGRVLRHWRCGKHSSRIGAGAPVYLAAVLEYMATEVLELAGNAARANKKARITPRHIVLAVRNDEELSKFFSAGVTVVAGGVLPIIQSVLLPKKSKNPPTLTTLERSTRIDRSQWYDSDDDTSVVSHKMIGSDREAVVRRGGGAAGAGSAVAARRGRADPCVCDPLGRRARARR